MPQKPLTISLVIPAYNEESHLADCLRSALAQQSPFYEIIVVDNNSNDSTTTVVERFPRVTVLHEAKQGVVFARNLGFDTARGDIIARIDADTILPSNWTIVAERLFAGTDIDAVSGVIGFTDVPFPKIFEKIDLIFRKYVASRLAARNEQYLFGANMAIRKSSWKQVRHTLCSKVMFHEDMDLAAHLINNRAHVVFAEELRAEVSARRIDCSFGAYRPYVLASSRTYAAHGLAGRKYMYLPESLALIFYSPLRLLYRSYDQQTGQLSLRTLLRRVEGERISPVAELT